MCSRILFILASVAAVVLSVVLVVQSLSLLIKVRRPRQQYSKGLFGFFGSFFKKKTPQRKNSVSDDECRELQYNHIWSNEDNSPGYVQVEADDKVKIYEKKKKIGPRNASLVWAKNCKTKEEGWLHEDWLGDDVRMKVEWYDEGINSGNGRPPDNSSNSLNTTYEEMSNDNNFVLPEKSHESFEKQSNNNNSVEQKYQDNLTNAIQDETILKSIFQIRKVEKSIWQLYKYQTLAEDNYEISKLLKKSPGKSSYEKGANFLFNLYSTKGSYYFNVVNLFRNEIEVFNIASTVPTKSLKFNFSMEPIIEKILETFFKITPYFRPGFGLRIKVKDLKKLKEEEDIRDVVDWEIKNICKFFETPFQEFEFYSPDWEIVYVDDFYVQTPHKFKLKIDYGSDDNLSDLFNAFVNEFIPNLVEFKSNEEKFKQFLLQSNVNLFLENELGIVLNFVLNVNIFVSFKTEEGNVLFFQDFFGNFMKIYPKGTLKNVVDEINNQLKAQQHDGHSY